MNKKILSLAVAAALAVPMAAQADVSVNGAVSMDLYNDSTSTASLSGGDAGTSKLEINVKDGDAFAKVAFNTVNMFGGAAPGAREHLAGIKLGGANVSVGRLASAYAGTMKVDTMTANFLEARDQVGGVSKVSSFDNGMLGVDGKSGDVSWALQYGIADTTNARLNAGVKFKAGPASVGIGYQTDSAGNTSTGLSAKMKFGDIAVAASFENADSAHMNGTNVGGTAETSIFADVSMPMGGGTVGLGLGSNTTNSTTFTRVSYQQKMGAATITAGARSADGATRAGLGLAVRF